MKNYHVPEDRSRAARILAKSLFRELVAQGYDLREIISLSAELIALVSRSLGRSGEDHGR